MSGRGFHGEDEDEEREYVDSGRRKSQGRDGGKADACSVGAYAWWMVERWG